VQNVKLQKLIFEKYIFNLINSYYFSKQEESFGVAVSGGPDSMLMLHVVSKWAKKKNKTLKVFNFNNNLRPASIKESLLVKKACKELKCSFLKIDWINKPNTAIMEKARIARYSEISKVCKQFGIKTLFLGHHADDIAETVSIRLLNNTSIDGLCPIFRIRQLFNIKLFRPFLEIKKKELLKLNQLYKIKFIEDPSNYNDKYLRAKVRKILVNEVDLKNKLIKASKIFCKLRYHTNNYIKLNFIKYIIYKKEGYLVINRSIFQIYPKYMLINFLKYTLIRIGNKYYPPQTKLLELIYLNQEQKIYFSLTLSGCIIKFNKKKIYIIREFNNISNNETYINQYEKLEWDNRFLITNNTKSKLKILPLGKVMNCPEYKKNYIKNKKDVKKIPYKARIALPLIKTLEGSVFIPHLNIHGLSKDVKNIEIDTIDFYNKKYDNIL
jgi:tRNA(Ile)-lysidine synthase